MQNGEQFTQDYNIDDAAYINTPTKFDIPGGIVDVAVTGANDRIGFCVIKKTDNTVYCWGSNAHGETGTGIADTTVKNPTAVVIDDKFASVSTETLSTCAVSTKGQLYCWGFYGPGLTTNKPTLINNIPGNPKIAFVHLYLLSEKAGPSIIAITDKGETYAWGDNSHAQLGNGNTNYVATPTRVLN
jgi:alpha-tubulin suppressor-like RCC1 family protein